MAAQPASSARPLSRIEQALALQQRGQLADAERILRAILAAEPGQLDAQHLLGLICHQQGRNVEALQLVGAVLKRAPRSAQILNNYGLILAALARHQEALACFEDALAMGADNLAARRNRAASLKRLRQFDQALAAYEAVLAVNPNDLEALNECGGLHTWLGCPAEAVACFDRALAVAPHIAELHINKGTALVALNRQQEALESFAAAIAIDPERAEAQYNASLVRLRLGDFRSGWRQYEWRWRKFVGAGQGRSSAAPLWLGGEPIRDKTILLLAEQGLGDTIHFVRYAPLVAALGAKVVLGVQSPLKAIAATVPGVSLVLGEGEPLPPVDFLCPLLSLPLAFQTELASVPANIPYLRPQDERLNKWRGRLPGNGRPRIGLCWAGSGTHLNDRNRSIALEHFATLLSVPGVDFVSLQKEVGEPQSALLRAHGVTQLGREFTDFADTAAVLAMLDLLVSVDTSVAHLAGAMGKAVAIAALRARFPLAARSERQPLVSDHAALPATRHRRLGRSARPLAAGLGRAPWPRSPPGRPPRADCKPLVSMIFSESRFFRLSGSCC
ncbi:MAG: tetratricopeptide repeat protein [Xanthobacteraceae bacterium]